MTQTDTSREVVERDAEYWERWAADIRANNGSVADAANMDAICARYRALLARAEKADAERDTAWNAALDEIERLRVALGEVIDCNHHNFTDGPPPKYVRIAREALKGAGQ